MCVLFVTFYILHLTDDNKFGQKLLEKMGWSKGQGLGKNLQGMSDPVKCKVKDDLRGI